MGLPTRADLISAGKWKVVTVETEEGAFRLAKPSAEATLRVQDLHKRKQAGEDVDKDVMAETLLSACVDEQGRPVFADLEEARAGLGSVSFGTLIEITNAVAKLQAGDLQVGEAPPGKSAAT